MPLDCNPKSADSLLEPASPQLFKQRFWVICLVCLGFTIASQENVLAHATGESYVWLNVEEDRFTGRVELNLDDVREKLGVAVPSFKPPASQESPESDVRLEILKRNRDPILDYIREHFQLHLGENLIPVEYQTVTIRDLNEVEGNYAVYEFETSPLDVPDRVTVTNRLCLENDAFHRSLLCIERNRKSGQEFGGEFVAMVFGSHNPVQEFDLTNIEALLRPRDFVWQGVLHIWVGIDHVLFIIALLLPAVLKRVDGSWKPVDSFSQAFINILKIVTIFTVAHSITLSLAALGVLDLQSRLVESIIALSIVLVAANNVRPKFNDKTWLVIFGFGLFHGMGFASVMSDLPFRMLNLVKVLIGFNVGVELGQLAIVAAVFPVIYLLRRTAIYQSVVLIAGSIVIGVVACYWFVERATGA